MPKIGFIGQGWIGKNYADNFEERGLEVVRYALEEPYAKNKEKIADCDIVFIAVPTPTVPEGFNDSVVRTVVKLVGAGKTAVIKSTIIPGTTESVQAENPDIFVLHSPEFLTEMTAKRDTDHPFFNIIGIPIVNDEYRAKAEQVMNVLPPAPTQKICAAREAELFKYARNCFFYTKVIYMNLLFDLAKSIGADWGALRQLLGADPWIGGMHLDPVHKSGRGAGGDCFIKDFAAFLELYRDKVGDEKGIEVLLANVEKNLELLLSTGKDLKLLVGVYGEQIKPKSSSRVILS